MFTDLIELKHHFWRCVYLYCKFNSDSTVQ